MVDRRLIEEWIKKADEDSGFASSIIENSTYFAQICFHYQQAAEKYLKSFIIAYDLEFSKIHDLIKLLNTCLLKEPSLSIIQDECIYLNRFYIDTRYPVHWPTHYTKEDALNAKKSTENISSTIKKYLREYNM
ncbi:MAG: HEPN domain-containing protein [Candidatus Scalindua sp.]|nr:HEPN domain-containing protein [Candidatus Scalindua sp.]